MYHFFNDSYFKVLPCNQTSNYFAFLQRYTILGVDLVCSSKHNSEQHNTNTASV